MPELVLPGVYIEERPEALIVPGPITVGNIGIVGTAQRGELGTVHVVSTLAEAKQLFGEAGDFVDGTSLTLVRALEQAYLNGASTVFAARVTSTEDPPPPPAPPDGDNSIPPWGRNTKARLATFDVAAEGGGIAATLKAKGHGAWGNHINIVIKAADAPPPNAVRVTLSWLTFQEVYTVATGSELVTKIMAPGTGSGLVTAVPGDKPAGKPALVPATPPTSFKNGVDANDATDTDYGLGLDQLLNENVHIILAAGRDGDAINGLLDAHVQEASTDRIKRDRIAVTGSAKGAAVAALNLNSARMIFVQPGIRVPDVHGALITLPGSYSAAAVAGMLSARDPHISLTNKTLAGIAGLETKFNSGQLEQLVTARVLALEDRQGFRVVKAITTQDGAFRQITTRRIVDFAKFGVRSAADPYIGLLNNDRVRKALKGSINGFLAGMVLDEMLESYELDVTATRDEEIRGIARVVMTLRVTFSIDFIQVVMFLG